MHLCYVDALLQKAHRKRYKKILPSGIFVLLNPLAEEAAQQMIDALPKATRLHESAKTVGSSNFDKIMNAGFNLIPKPSKKLPNHYRLIHPDGVDGFNSTNLEKLSKEFKDVDGVK